MTLSEPTDDAGGEPDALAALPRCLREIAHPAVVVPGDTTCGDVERIFARQPGLTSVVAADLEGPRLVPRRHLTLEMAGRLGYGRTLHARKPVTALVRVETLVLAGETPLADAAALALARPPELRYEDVLVLGTGASIWAVTVAELFHQLARLHEHRAVHDPLTGLANRAGFTAALAAACADRRRRPVVLFIDLDDFKTINDSLGHGAGDELLCGVAARLASAVRGDDVVARLAGDEFAVLLGDADERAAREIARRMLHALREPLHAGERVVSVTASVGLAAAQGAESADDLLRNADLAMYEAKHGGKDRVAAYGPALLHAASSRLDLRTALGAALREGELRLAYQPVVALDDGRTVGAEALLRWRHPTRGEIAPSELLPVAEETGLVHPIGAWVLREAVAQLARWGADEPRLAGLALAVNVSIRQLEDPRFAAAVAEVLHESAVAADRLTLELTESALVRETDAVLTTLAELRATGVRLAVDDFGTGYSSFARLDHLPVQVLKIDRRFTTRLGPPRATRLMRGLLELGRAMGLQTVAEGVETERQAAILRALGCPLGQGFLFGRPMAPDDLAAHALGAGDGRPPGTSPQGATIASTTTS